MSSGKEKYGALLEYASTVDMELYRVAFMYLKQIKQISAYEQLSILQSIVDFNVVFIYNIAPEVILHLKSIEWLNCHLKSVKRKIKLKELLDYDTIIYWNNPADIDEFKKLLNNKI